MKKHSKKIVLINIVLITVFVALCFAFAVKGILGIDGKLSSAGCNYLYEEQTSTGFVYTVMESTEWSADKVVSDALALEAARVVIDKGNLCKRAVWSFGGSVASI